MPVTAELTPMLRHYLEVKAAHPESLLFYRMGDFFELFFDDAIEAASLLDLTLTARQKGTESEAPMCGVPHHAIDGYVAKLLKLGRKVVLCDQVEDPAQAKGLVRREVTRILTPGTLSETELLESKEESFLAVVTWNGERGEAAFLDVSTGTFFVRRFAAVAEALAELEAVRPRELLADEASLPAELAEWARREVVCRTGLADRLESSAAAAERLRRRFGVDTLRGFGLEPDEPAVRAAAAALAYAEANQLAELAHVRDIAVRETRDRLVLDGTTLANLEVFRRAGDGGAAGTLVELVDRSATAAGGRAVREWLRAPLREPAAIARRHDAVEALIRDATRRGASASGAAWVRSPTSSGWRRGRCSARSARARRQRFAIRSPPCPGCSPSSPPCRASCSRTPRAPIRSPSWRAVSRPVSAPSRPPPSTTAA